MSPKSKARCKSHRGKSRQARSTGEVFVFAVFAKLREKRSAHGIWETAVSTQRLLSLNLDLIMQFLLFAGFIGRNSLRCRFGMIKLIGQFASRLHRNKNYLVQMESIRLGGVQYIIFLAKKTCFPKPYHPNHPLKSFEFSASPTESNDETSPGCSIGCLDTESAQWAKGGFGDPPQGESLGFGKAAKREN